MTNTRFLFYVLCPITDFYFSFYDQDIFYITVYDNTPFLFYVLCPITAFYFTFYDQDMIFILHFMIDT